MSFCDSSLFVSKDDGTGGDDFCFSGDACLEMLT